MKKLLLTLLATALFSTAFAGSATKATSVITSAQRIDNGVQVQWAESGTVSLKMFTASGRVVKSINRLTITAGNTTSIDLSNLAKGVFYISINTGNDLQQIALAN